MACAIVTDAGIPYRLCAAMAPGATSLMNACWAAVPGTAVAADGGLLLAYDGADRAGAAPATSPACACSPGMEARPGCWPRPARGALRALAGAPARAPFPARAPLAALAGAPALGEPTFPPTVPAPAITPGIATMLWVPTRPAPLAVPAILAVPFLAVAARWVVAPRPADDTVAAVRVPGTAA